MHSLPQPSSSSSMSLLSSPHYSLFQPPASFAQPKHLPWAPAPAALSLWGLSCLGAPAEALQQGSVRLPTLKTGRLTGATKQLLVWTYPWARAGPGKVISSHLEAHPASHEAQANKIKVSNMTRFSWVLMRRTKETHSQLQSNPLDKMSGLKYESVRAFQPTIKNVVSFQEKTQLCLLTKSQIHPIAAAKHISAWQSSNQQKQIFHTGRTR